MPYFAYGQTEIDYLSGRDKRLAAAIRHIGPLQRAVEPDLFTALVTAIVDQQISTAAARTVRGRMLTLLGRWSPEGIAACPAEQLQSCGLSFRKVSYLQGVSQAVLSGQLDLARLKQLPDEQLCAELMALPGVGRWTAEMLMIFSLQRPDVLSYGDLGIRRGMMRLYHHQELPPERFERYRRRYAPYASVAGLYLWEIAGRESWEL